MSAEKFDNISEGTCSGLQFTRGRILSFEGASEHKVVSRTRQCSALPMVLLRELACKLEVTVMKLFVHMGECGGLGSVGEWKVVCV